MSTPEIHERTAPPFADVDKCPANACARDRIFEAARNLFYRYGIRGVSVDMIAAEANTTKVTLYRVFASKDELIVKVLEEQARRVWQWWDTVTAPYQGNPRQQIEALFADVRDRMCCDRAMRGCPLTNAAVEVVDEDHPARPLIVAHKQEVNRRLRELCKEMGARQPDVLGDALSLLVSVIFSARVSAETTGGLSAVYDAAMALLDSPALGVPQP